MIYRKEQNYLNKIDKLNWGIGDILLFPDRSLYMIIGKSGPLRKSYQSAIKNRKLRAIATKLINSKINVRRILGSSI